MTAFAQPKQAVRVNVPDLDQLETIADWRDDLTDRIRRAQLRFELIGLDCRRVRLFGSRGGSL